MLLFLIPLVEKCNFLLFWMVEMVGSPSTYNGVPVVYLILLLSLDPVIKDSNDVTAHFPPIAIWELILKAYTV